MTHSTRILATVSLTLNDVRRAAEDLGYCLVPIRVAAPLDAQINDGLVPALFRPAVTDKPGFDGRARSAGMKEADILDMPAASIFHHQV